MLITKTSDQFLRCKSMRRRPTPSPRHAALSAIDGQKKARAVRSGERNEAAATLATLKAERASLAAQGHKIETEAAPIRYVAELIGVEIDSERTIRWLIPLMVLRCDPLAIAPDGRG